MTQKLEIVRGTNCSFGVMVTNADGTPFALSENQALVFALKKNPNDVERLFTKKITNSIDAGTFYLELFPYETLELLPGKYYYDVGLQHGTGNFFNIIEASEFLIKPNISELGDGA